MAGSWKKSLSEKFAPVSKRTKKVAENTKDALLLTAVVASEGMHKAIVKGAEVYWWLTASKEEKAAARAAEAEDRKRHENIEAFVAEENARFLVAFTTNVLRHPKAGASDIFADMSSYKQGDSLDAARTLASAISGISMLAGRILDQQDGSPSLQFTKTGEIVIQGHDPISSDVVMSELRVMTGCSDAQAKQIWNWVYELGASGKAQNLLPEMITEVNADGHLAVSENTIFRKMGAGYERHKKIEDLHAADKHAALGMKAPSPKKGMK